jgi:hypothetical protein
MREVFKDPSIDLSHYEIFEEMQKYTIEGLAVLNSRRQLEARVAEQMLPCLESRQHLYLYPLCLRFRPICLFTCFKPG